jgi:hypothetical protein
VRTNLVYSVNKEETFNYKTEKYEKHVTSKGFEFYVTGAKTEQEHDNMIKSFEEFLRINGVCSDGFGSGTWNEALKYGTDGQKDFFYLSIIVDDTDGKENIISLYKEWKLLINRHFTLDNNKND